MKIRVQTRLKGVKIKPINLDDIMWEILDTSAKVLITEVAHRIPVWTGQAVGSLLPAARLLKKVKIDFSLFQQNGTYANSTKNWRTGAQQGEADRFKTGKKYIFNFDSSLIDYMVENEHIDQEDVNNSFQRERAWRIFEEITPSVQEYIDAFVKWKFKNVFSGAYVGRAL